MNSRIGLGLLLVAAGLLAVVLGISRGGGQTWAFITIGLLAEAGGLFLIYSGSPKKKQ